MAHFPVVHPPAAASVGAALATCLAVVVPAGRARAGHTHHAVLPAPAASVARAARPDQAALPVAVVAAVVAGSAAVDLVEVSAVADLEVEVLAAAVVVAVEDKLPFPVKIIHSRL